MSNVLITIISVAIVFGVVAIILFPYLKKKGINIGSALQEIKNLLNDMQSYVNAAKALEPTNKTIKLIDIVGQYAKIAVNYAEQMYISSQLSDDKRKPTAEQYIYEILEKMDIKVDDNVKTIVSGAIEAEVFASKTDSEKASQEIKAVKNELSKAKIEAEAKIKSITNEKNKVIADKNKVEIDKINIVKENDQLKNQLNNVKAAAQNIAKEEASVVQSAQVEEKPIVNNVASVQK